jgi:hypothetical protein
MRALVASVAACLSWLSLAAFQANLDRPLEALLSKAELAEYEAKPSYRDRLEVFTTALGRNAALLRSQVEQRRIEDLLVTLGNLQALAHHAMKENAPPGRKKELRSSQVRKLEIRVRKLLETVDDAKTVAPFEYHAQFSEVTRDLSQLRSRLLQQMFGEAAGGERPEDQSSLWPPNEAFFLLVNGRPPLQEDSRRRDEGELVGDHFTDAEYVKIQDNQELVKRVDIFLEIAETRLKEIQRRLRKEEWKEKDDNPLEFHSTEEMVHAYERALTSIMYNIDEKARYKLATEKNIRKALEKLNKKITLFEPQLAPIKQLAIDSKDPLLYKLVLKAEKTSAVARKGSLLGLGSPVQ